MKVDIQLSCLFESMSQDEAINMMKKDIDIKSN